MAVVVLMAFAARYQPLEFGGASGGAFPGLPPTVGARDVDTFAGQDGVYYIPPQPGPFTVSESITNTGPRRVTILAVLLLPPGSGFPVMPAGESRWMPMTGEPRGGGQLINGLVLQPHQYVRVGIPVRMRYRCADAEGWSTLDSFYVHERFLTFTRWVQPAARHSHRHASTASGGDRRGLLGSHRLQPRPRGRCG